MNQRKAKELRRKAKEIAQEQGLDVTTRMSEGARYQAKRYSRTMFDLLGNPIPYTVYTATLTPSYREVYQKLKKEEKVK